MHGAGLAPSPWVMRWAALLRPGTSVLDVACGSGRHLRWLAARGFAVTGVDRDADALAPLQSLAEVVQADIESGPWPFAGRRFDAVVVTNYLWRPLLPTLVGALAPGGLLVYETFADGHQHFGRPSRPDFLLQPGELLRVATGLRVVAFEDGYLDTPPRCVQRIVAVAPLLAPLSAPDGPARYPLQGSGELPDPGG
ncbi:MAG: class I SAM-dependent methyltransferase [Rubrivivax sp.]|nr:class I SAM-dependent methyltransferase [Rubrivivax sp.]